MVWYIIVWFGEAGARFCSHPSIVEEVGSSKILWTTDKQPGKSLRMTAQFKIAASNPWPRVTQYGVWIMTVWLLLGERGEGAASSLGANIWKHLKTFWNPSKHQRAAGPQIRKFGGERGEWGDAWSSLYANLLLPLAMARLGQPHPHYAVITISPAQFVIKNRSKIFGVISPILPKAKSFSSAKNVF